ncbi:MAG: aldehyde ferredoxin oxidoreductase family protein [Bacillota bacterium]
MKYQGYAGKVLRVDLTDRKVSVEETPEELARGFLGGNGFGVRVLWDETGPGVDALDPGNRLVFASGPLSGTTWPGAGRLEVIAKSPLTGIYGDSNSGGFFAPELKYAGFDMVVITGRAEAPVFLSITPRGVEIRDAGHLWSMGARSAEKAIAAQLGDPDVKTCTIGPAGENLVRFASILVSSGRSAGRSGMGAVMGCKNLKAIAVRGFGGVTLARPDLFYDLSLKMHKAIRENKLYGVVHEYGSPGLTPLVNMTGRFPTKNFQLGSFEHHDKIGGEALKAHFVKHLACFSCGVGCDKMFHVRSGPFAGTRSTSLEYEVLGALGAGVLVDDLDAVVKANSLCDELGMDVISAGRTISFLMEIFDRGIVSPSDIDGLEPRWGDARLVLDLLQRIAARQGIGDLLAEGVRRMAQRIGRGSEGYAMEVKGQEIACQDGRAQQSMGLAHVTSARGADHLKAYPTIDETGFPSKAIGRYGEQYMPDLIDPHSSRHKAMVVKDGEDYAAVVDSAGHCKIGGAFVIAEIYWPEEAMGLAYATGMEVDEASLRATGERIYNLMRLYNVRLGISRADDRLPRRFTEEPAQSGTATGRVVDLDAMLKEYYRLRGWDPERGLPERDTLRRLGLDFAMECLEREGVLLA